MSDRLLSVDEVADFLAIPAGTLYQWRYRGLGPTALKVGRHLRYRPADVERWLDTRSAAYLEARRELTGEATP